LKNVQFKISNFVLFAIIFYYDNSWQLLNLLQTLAVKSNYEVL